MASKIKYVSVSSVILVMSGFAASAATVPVGDGARVIESGTPGVTPGTGDLVIEDLARFPEDDRLQIRSTEAGIFTLFGTLFTDAGLSFGDQVYDGQDAFILQAAPGTTLSGEITFDHLDDLDYNVGTAVGVISEADVPRFVTDQDSGTITFNDIVVGEDGILPVALYQNSFFGDTPGPLRYEAKYTLDYNSPPPAAAVPVPAALPLMAVGLAALGLIGRRRRRSRAV